MSSSASSSEEPLDEGDEDEGEGVAHLFMRWLQDQRDERDASLSDELRPAQMVRETDLANDIRVHTGMGRYGVSPVSIATVLGQRAVTGPLSMNRQRLINCLLLPTHPRRVSAGCALRYSALRCSHTKVVAVGTGRSSAANTVRTAPLSPWRRRRAS